MQENIAPENLRIWREAASENRELRLLQIEQLAKPYAGVSPEDEALRLLVRTLWEGDDPDPDEQLAFCRAITKRKAQALSHAPLPSEPRVAMLSGETFSRAFTTFSPLFRGAKSLYFSSLGEVLEETAAGEADFAILPIEDAKGGRFLHFFEELDRLELHITHTCEVLSPESERKIRFALLSRHHRPDTVTGGDRILECSLSGEDGRELGRLLLVAEHAGLTLLRTDTLPSPYREGSFLYYASFHGDASSETVLECYLSLFMPRASVTARYFHLKGE